MVGTGAADYTSKPGLSSMPGPSIPRQQCLRRSWSPRPRRIERQGWRGFGLPVFEHRVDNRPGLVDPVRTRKERLIALHGIVEQPFVGTGRAFDAKRQIIAEMHGHWTQTDVWPGLFGQKRVRNALV